jgi:hypothetical protein
MSLKLGLKKKLRQSEAIATTEKKPLLVVTMMVRNEEDILEECLQHHREQGVEHFIVTENASIDNTRKILASQTDVTIIDEPSHTYEQGKWHSRMAEVAFKMGAKWIVPTDADEFWYGLPNLLLVPEKYGIVLSDRLYEHPPTDAIAKPFRRSQMPYFDKSPRNFGLWGQGRFCFRPFPGAVVGMGVHCIENYKENNIEICMLASLWQHHYPIRGYEHYEQKVKITVDALEAGNHHKGFGEHMRIEFQLLKLGLLREEYERRVLKIVH